MQEVVEIPSLVADDEVVVLVADQVVVHHEVGDQDLVHLAEGLEHMEVMLAGLRSRWPDSLARWSDAGCTRSPALRRNASRGAG